MSSEASDPRAQWTREFHRARDYFEFARAAARAAGDGDSRAQYYLAQVLLECEIQVSLISPMQGRSVDERVDAYLESFPGMQDNHRRRIREDAQRCAAFFVPDALSELPLPEDARGHQYWLDQALAADDPLAVMDRAIRSASTGAWSDSGADKETARDLLLRDVRVAVDSKEPAAIVKIGWIYSNQNIADDQALQGPAWLIAACEMGFDCSYANPDIAGGCGVAAGICNEGVTLLDVFQRDLGARRYAAAYAASQDIRYKIENGDWEGLQQYLELKM